LAVKRGYHMRSVARDEPLARELFPLAERLDPKPWMGGAHHGFTLGPVTGRLLAEMMTGEEPFTEPSCYAASGSRNGDAT
jgi:D-lysine oxidase